MSLENDSKILSGIHELYKIPDPIARVGAQFVFEMLHPDEEVTIGYETDEFWHNNGEKTEGHTPDLSVYLPDGEGYMREFTKSKKKFCIQSLNSLPIWLGKSDVVLSQRGRVDLLTVLVEMDPKSKQKRVMQHVAPKVDYQVWDGDFLEALQKQYPEYEFFPQ